jgi:Icc-related predicted phosphoesterase
MRIVAVADTHTFQSELGEIPDGDVFVHAGDLLRRGTLAELEAVSAWIRGLPHRHKVVIAGNHDWCFMDEREACESMLGEHVIYLQDQAAVIGGLQFWGSPWQPEYNDWAFNLPRGPALAEKWALIPQGTDVLVTHGPPRGFGDRSPIGRHIGCEELLPAVHRVSPALHLFGHIHQDGGFWRAGGTSFANVTTWECERSPTVIDIDPVSRATVPVGIPAARRIT